MQDAGIHEVESSTGQAGWFAELSLSQRKAVRACLLFLFHDDENGWSWYSVFSNMSVQVMPGEEKNLLLVLVRDWVKDCNAGAVINNWTTQIRLTGNWKQRLRQATGEALALAQSRHKCPKCDAPVVLVVRREDSVQFFGCPNYKSTPRCHGSLDIIDHDVALPLS